jgi:hypothetical protein
VCLKDLAIELYDNILMMGRGLDDDDVEQSRVAIGDVGPWFWLHNVENLSGRQRYQNITVYNVYMNIKRLPHTIIHMLFFLLASAMIMVPP